MPQSIISKPNQPIQYHTADDGTCKCGERDSCILVEPNQQVYSQLQILPCGDFEVCNNSLGDELVCNGGFDLGPELVTNGTFTGSATGWTLGTNWAYNANAIRSTGSTIGETASQSIPSLTVSKTYSVSYTISNYVSGDVAVVLGATLGTTRTANGTYEELLVVASGTTLLFSRVSVDFSGDIDDVSVKLVDCWTFGTGWEWDQGRACQFENASSLEQTLALTTPAYYLLSFDVISYSAGALTVGLGAASLGPITASGSYSTVLLVASGTLLTFDSDADFNACIDNVSVKQLTTCWDADEIDWTTNEIGACHETGNTTDLQYSSSTFTSGKYYHITITVSNATAGGINVVLGTTVLAPQTSGNGIFDFWGESNGTDLFIRPTSDFDGCISELDVDEYCNEYEFHLIPATGDEFEVVDMTQYYTRVEDIYNLTDFSFSDVFISDGTHAGTISLPFGCYKLCLVDCCSEQQTAPSLLQNHDFALNSQFWTFRNVTFGSGFATFLSGFPERAKIPFLQQALITTHDADCLQIEFDFANEGISGVMQIYIDGVLVDTETLVGVGTYSNTFNNVPAGAIIRFETPDLLGDLIIDDIIVSVPPECQPIYDQCTPCINYQADFQCTRLIEGFCDGNALGFEFDDANGDNQFKLSLRAKCDLLHPTYEQEQEDYDFSNGVTSLSYGQNKKFQSLTFYPLPEFKHDVISLEKICDTFQIDTVDYFVKKGDYTPEWNRNSSTDLAPSRIEVKKKDQTLYNTNCG